MQYWYNCLNFVNFLTRIVVAPKKRLFEASYTTLLVAVLFAYSPISAKAGTISDFTDKVKAIFVKEDAVEEVETGTPQTMRLFSPTVVEASTVEEEAELRQDAEAMQVTSGSLRFSTEDIDFPVSDAISVYEVKKGDTLTTVAKLFNVSKNTIIWANDLKSQTLTPGETIVILPMTGIKHVIRKGDTIKSIARKYKADEEDIAKFNGITVESDLSVGDTVLVPDGEIAVSQPAKKVQKNSKGVVISKILNTYSHNAPSGFLIRPVVSARRSQGIHGHNGVDLAGTPGTPILASATGKVIVARSGGYNGGYGSMVIMIHDGGIQTVYAHLRAVHVTQGQYVTQGTQIGELGNTGRSTGPHLHFEVRGAKNPF